MKKHCLICQREFVVYPSNIDKKFYCSQKCCAESRKGKKTWNYGLKGWMSEKHYRNLINAIPKRNKEHKISSEQARINGMKAKRICGEKHYMFKPDTEERIKFHHKIRQTKEYKQWRATVFQRDRHICQNCLKSTKLQAHHIKSSYEYQDLIFNVDNGITLCVACHMKIHSPLRHFTEETLPPLFRKLIQPSPFH